MVRAKKKKGSSLTDIRQVWAGVTPSQWIAVLNKHAPAGKWVEKNPGQILGHCPFHDEKTPSFYIYTDKGYARCYGGSCGKYVKNPTILLQKITGKTPRAVLGEIYHSAWGLKFRSGLTDEVNAFEDLQEAKEALFWAMQTALLAVLEAVRTKDTAALAQWSYCLPTVKFLQKRQIPLTEKWVRRYGIGVMPTWRDLRALINSKYNSPDPKQQKFRNPEILPRVQEYIPENKLRGSNPVEVFTYTGSLAFCYRTDPDTIGRIKLRLPGQKDFMFLGTKAEKIGVFGMNAYRYQINREKTLHAVEGEFDQLSMLAAELQKTSGAPECIVFGCGGGGIDSSGLEFLKHDLGFERIVAIGDNDAGGIGFTRTLFERVGEGNVAAFDWDKSAFSGKKHCDPDELVKAGHYDAFRAEFLDDSQLLSRHDFVFKQLVKKAEQTTDVSTVETEMRLYADALPTILDRQIVVDKLNEDKTIPKALVHGTLLLTSNDDQYIELCRQMLSTMIIPFFQDENNRVTLYSMTKKRMFSVTTDREKPLINAIELNVTGQVVYEWCRDKLGEPRWLLYEGYGEDKTERSRTDRERIVNALFISALKGIIVDDVETSSAIRRFGQGVHHFAHYKFAPGHGFENSLYIANGKSVYKSDFTRDSDRIQFEKLDVPRDKFIVFNSAEVPWSRAIASEEDLNTDFETKFGVTKQELFWKIVDYVSTGFTFSTDKNIQKKEAEYFAAFIFYVVIAQVFPVMHQAYINALFSSGKSTLLLGVLSSNMEGGELTLVEHSQAFTDFTAAAVRAAMLGTPLLMCLDEFEDPDAQGLDRKIAERCRAVSGLLRGNITGGVPAIRGTQTGGLREYFFRAPVAAAGINPPRNEADVSRWNFVFPDKVVGRTHSPLSAIVEKFTKEERDVMRQGVTVLPIQQLPEILRAYEKVKSYEMRKDLPKGIENRALKSISPIGAILEWVGIDSFTWLCEYLTFKKSKLAQERPQERDTVLSDILETPNVRLETDTGIMTGTVGAVLYDQDIRESINRSYCGVYYLRSRGRAPALVVFYLPQIVTHLLKNHAKYRGRSTIGVMKKELSQNPAVLKLKRKKIEQIAGRLKPYLGSHNIRTDGIVVAEFRNVIADIEKPDKVQESLDDKPM